MGARRLISGTGSKGLTGARGVEKLANRLDRIRRRQFVLARVNRTPRKPVRKYLFVMRRNKLLMKYASFLKPVRRNKGATLTCNISRSLSHEAKQARYT